MWQHALVFLPLLVVALELVGHSFGQAGRFIGVALVIVGFGFAFKPYKRCQWQSLLRPALISTAGAMFTFLLSAHLNLNTLVASGAVALVGSAFFNFDDQLVLYLGTFVGMTSVAKFPTLPPLIMAGFLGGVFWELFSETWIGVGGRLGSLAATAVLVVLIILGGGVY